MAESHKCPVYGKYYFETENDMDICDWCNDSLQEENPDYEGGANHMSLNQARKAFKKGIQIR